MTSPSRESAPETLDIELAEWESKTIDQATLEAATGGVFGSAEKEALKPLVAASPTWGRGLCLSAYGTVGELSLGRLFVRVRPHLALGDLYRLFAWVEGADIKVIDDVLGERGAQPTTFIELLARGLLREVDRLLQTDLLRRWYRREERLLILRGQPRFESIGASPPALGIPCRYQTLSANTLENRLVRRGLEVAVRCLRGPARTNALSKLAVFSDLAGTCHPERTDFERARLNDSPRTAAYRAALRLSEWLVLGGGPISTWGAGGISGWTLNVATLFERAVAQGLSRWASERGLVARPQSVDRISILDGERKTYAQVRPDVELLQNDEVIAVVDAKYKAYARANLDGRPTTRIEVSDRYQLAFYGAANGAGTELFIVVPKDHGAALGPRWKTIHIVSHRLRLVEVDLVELCASGKLPLGELFAECL